MVLKNCTTGKMELAVGARLDSISAGRIVYAPPNFVGAGGRGYERPAVRRSNILLWDTPNQIIRGSFDQYLASLGPQHRQTRDKVGDFRFRHFYGFEDFGYGSVVEKNPEFLGGNVTTISDDPLSHGAETGHLAQLSAIARNIGLESSQHEQRPPAAPMRYPVGNFRRHANLWSPDNCVAKALIWFHSENGSHDQVSKRNIRVPCSFHSMIRSIGPSICGRSGRNPGERGWSGDRGQPVQVR